MNERRQHGERFRFVKTERLAVAGALLVLLFVSLGAEFGPAAPAGVRAMAWSLQILLGLLVLRAAILALAARPALAAWPDPLLLLVAGFATSVVVSPAYFTLEQVLDGLGFETDDPSPISATTWLLAVLEEWTDVVGPVIGVALLLGLPAWWNRPATADVDDEPAAALAARRVTASGSAIPATASTSTPDRRATELDVTVDRPRLGGCLSRLPPELGTDVIALRSELQYLRVWTPRGSALILGSLREAEAVLGESTGFSPHRAWWVATRHVGAVRQRERGYVCLLDNGVQVPVSRRRQGAVVARFGDSSVFTPADGA
ncbi:MAG: LytTR family DNA-binding domain-containing protein [Steroidobacteraceae bacterium]|jgi:hypothetical protein|nr:LytTR family DNA-binding domain-containing protein [Steroidobacteraceae bacterium]